MSTKATGSLSQFLHEVRNPLCNIYLACEMLKMSGLSEEQQMNLSIIVWALEDNVLIDVGKMKFALTNIIQA